MGRLFPLALMALLLVLSLPQRAAAQEDIDPWQDFNRSIFAFNEALDLWFFEPVAEAYDWAVPKVVQGMVTNFTTNLSTPQVLVNNLLQGKPDQAAEDLARMAVNSTFGLGGIIDIAADAGVAVNEEDFGQTFAVWGVPSGPYLVLPLFGPSNVRDGVGKGLDTAASLHSFFVPFYVSFGESALELINLRAALLKDIRDARAASFDYYIFLRNVYIQYRANAIADRDPQASAAPASDEDLYGFDDEELYGFDDEELYDLDEEESERFGLEEEDEDED